MQAVARGSVRTVHGRPSVPLETLSLKDLARDNLPIFECGGARLARRLRRGLFDTNEEQATQPAGMDPCSKTGSYFGPDPES